MMSPGTFAAFHRHRCEGSLCQILALVVHREIQMKPDIQILC